MSASWTVPEISPAAPCGSAATWIGAARAEGRPGFIQVGTEELCLRPAGSSSGGEEEISYWAFWSDIAHHELGQDLFRVHAGDSLTASLVLSDGLWRVALLDDASGASAQFTTGQEADASFFQEANWAQEDLRREGKLGVYPRTTPVEFSDVRVNSGAPRPIFLEALSIAAHGTYVAPTPLHDDAFALRYTRAPDTG